MILMTAPDHQSPGGPVSATDWPTWWDEGTLALLGTGNIELANQFARWCAQVHQDMVDIVNGGAP